MSGPNRDLGPCIVHWDPNGANIEFTKTFGGVFFRYEEVRAPIKRDQAGETDVSEVTIGVINPELEVPLSEEEVANLTACFANSVAGTNNLKVSNPVGDDVFPLARRVVVKPIINGVISLVEKTWLYIHRAFPRVTMEQAYDNSGQRTVKVIFKGFPDDYSSRLNELWRYGPESG